MKNKDILGIINMRFVKETDLENIKYMTKIINRTVKIIDTKTIIISHPFLSSIIWYDGKNFNNIFETGVEKWFKHFDKIVDNCESLDRLYMLYNSAWKLTFMKFCSSYMSKKDFSEYMADSWVIEDNPNMDCNLSLNEAIKYFKAADKKYLMTDSDYKYYCSLPDELEIYRGVSKGRAKYGLSWTEDIEKAKWFMNRFSNYCDDNDKLLLRVRIKKENVIAYFNTRNEKEILLDVFAVKDKIEIINNDLDRRLICRI